MKYPVIAAMLFVASSANAAITCVAGTYDTYTAAGFECEIDGAVFSNFSFPATPNGGDLEESDILVTPLSGPNFVGLRFTANFSATGGANGAGMFEGQVAEQYRFFYHINLAGGEFFNATVDIDGGSTFNPNPSKPSGYLVGLSVANDGAGASVLQNTPGQTDTGTLFTARSFISIDTLAQVIGGASASQVAPFGVGEFDSFDNTFEYELDDVIIPEPGTAALMLVGLAAVLRKAITRGPRASNLQ
jgi:hypothetical protein